MGHEYCFSSLLVGNGVVIHLPGLFEEGDKNEKKGIFGERFTQCARVYTERSVCYTQRCDLSSLNRSERLGEQTYRLRPSSPRCVQFTI